MILLNTETWELLRCNTRIAKMYWEHGNPNAWTPWPHLEAMLCFGSGIVSRNGLLCWWFQCSAMQSWSFWEGLEHGDSDLTHGLIHSHIHNLMALLRSGESFEVWGLTGVSRSLGVSLLPGSLEVTAFLHYTLLPLFLPHHRSTA